MLKAVFRTDASLKIGTGHVYRCITLADQLSLMGFECHFMSRDLDANLIDYTRANGYSVTELSAPEERRGESTDYGSWLAVPFADEMSDSKEALLILQPEILILDHYALNWEWTNKVVPKNTKVLVYDDLADRRHICDILLDQNLGRRSSDYADLTPSSTPLLIGPTYAVLRPQFAKRRPLALVDRQSREAKNLLIAVGGIDLQNLSGALLRTLAQQKLSGPLSCHVVLSSKSPWLKSLEAQSVTLPFETKILSDVTDMAALMAYADIAIGGAGGSAWERCCMGLPSVIVTLANNQVSAARALHYEGAAIYAGHLTQENIVVNVVQALLKLLDDNQRRRKMGETAAQICDGYGSSRVAKQVVDLLL